MSGFQTDVRNAPRSMTELASAAADAPVTITASMPPEVALQFAQFAKRSTYNTFYEFTEAHLHPEERRARAYQMIAGMEAIGRALAAAGYSPR